MVVDDESLWRRCELAWASWLGRQGFAVTPIGAAEGNTTRSRAPLTLMGGQYLRTPDISAIKQGKTTFWEVKSRARASVDRLTGESSHWVALDVFQDYLRLGRLNGTDVFVVLYEAPAATRPARWLQASVEQLFEVGREEVCRARDGLQIPAWVWPAAAMKVVEGPSVGMGAGSEPLLTPEGDGPPMSAQTLAPIERKLRRRRAGAETNRRARHQPLPHEWLDQEPALALDVLRRTLGIPHCPSYSVMRVGLEGVDLEALLGIMDYGMRLFIISSERPDWTQNDQRLQAFEDSRLLEWAVLPAVDGVSAWVVDGAGMNQHPGLGKVLAEANDLGGINLRQYEIVHSAPDCDVVVSAGAGTGKTETMAERIVFLLATGAAAGEKAGSVPRDLRMDDIALVTFTREAAAEMRERLSRTLLLRRRLCPSCALPVVGWMLQLPRADIATIHSFAKRLVMAGGGGIGVGPEARVAQLTMETQAAVQQALSDDLARLIKAYRGGAAVPAAHEWQRQLLELWQVLENNGVDVTGIAGHSSLGTVDWGAVAGPGLQNEVGALLRSALLEAARRMAEVHQQRQTLPTSSLVPVATAALDSGTTHLPPYRYLFVDEFQDTDPAQIELLLGLKQRVGAQLFVVGDVKQGIYRFRGAMGNAFNELDRSLEQRGQQPPSRFTLTRNFRTGATLLASLNPYFATWGSHQLLTYSQEDALQSRLDRPDTSRALEIRTINQKSFATEAAALVAQWHEGNTEATIGILCRENWQAIAVQEQVRALGLSCELRVGGSFWTSPAVRELRALLQAVSDPDDTAALLELCETRWAAGLLGGRQPRGIPVEAWGPVQEVPQPWRVRLAHLAESDSLPNDDLLPLQRRVREVSSLLETTPLLEWLIDCRDAFRPEGCSLPNPDDEAERRRYGRCLDHVIVQLDCQFEDSSLGLLRLLQWLTLQIATNRNEDEPDEVGSGKIVALTVHKAKGLEYAKVVVPCTDRPFGPSRKAQDRIAVIGGARPRLLWKWGKFTNVPPGPGTDWDVDAREAQREETRLLYVAMTRAKEDLVIMVDRNARAEAGDPRSWGGLIAGGNRG